MSPGTEPNPPGSPIVGGAASPIPAAELKPRRAIVGRIGLIFTFTGVAALAMLFLLRPS